MEIRTVPSESKKVGVPFVVGGVYRFRDSGDVRILMRKGSYRPVPDAEYAWYDPRSGDAAWTGWLRRSQIDFSDCEYVPDAELVIPE